MAIKDGTVTKADIDKFKKDCIKKGWAVSKLRVKNKRRSFKLGYKPCKGLNKEG